VAKMDKPSCNESLCKRCKYRLRRVFIPLDSSEYINMENDVENLNNEENIIILNHCLLLDMSIDMETTIECSHFIAKENDNEIKLFKHDI